MKIPILITALIVLIAACLTWFMTRLPLELKDLYGLIISAWSSAGALISANFVVYGYLINMKAFAEAQRPKILVFVANAWASKRDGSKVHMTQIHYRNVGTVECRELSLSATLIKDLEEVPIPGLFSAPFNLAVTDTRLREFLTQEHLEQYGIPPAVVSNFMRYRLRITYKFNSLDKPESHHRDYSWNEQNQTWDIA